MSGDNTLSIVSIVLSLISPLVSAIGWYVVSRLNRSNSAFQAEVARIQKIIDDIEELVDKIASVSIKHFLLPGSDSGARERQEELQLNFSKLGRLTKKVFQSGVPKSLEGIEEELWELCTGGDATNHDRPALLSDNIKLRRIRERKVDYNTALAAEYKKISPKT